MSMGERQLGQMETWADLCENCCKRINSCYPWKVKFCISAWGPTAFLALQQRLAVRRLEKNPDAYQEPFGWLRHRSGSIGTSQSKEQENKETSEREREGEIGNQEQGLALVPGSFVLILYIEGVQNCWKRPPDDHHQLLAGKVAGNAEISKFYICTNLQVTTVVLSWLVNASCCVR